MHFCVSCYYGPGRMFGMLSSGQTSKHATNLSILGEGPCHRPLHLHINLVSFICCSVDNKQILSLGCNTMNVYTGVNSTQTKETYFRVNVQGQNRDLNLNLRIRLGISAPLYKFVSVNLPNAGLFSLGKLSS